MINQLPATSVDGTCRAAQGKASATMTRPNESQPNRAALELDRTAFEVVRLEDADQSDIEYWKLQSPSQRLKALELTRQVLYGYRTGDRPQLSRFFEVVKPA
jgi:hypothetical protein